MDSSKDLLNIPTDSQPLKEIGDKVIKAIVQYTLEK
jgi:hypothetical protein